MNIVALRLLGIVLGVAVLTLVVIWFLKKEQVQKLRGAISWLLKVSFFDFVRIFIFIKPLKKYFMLIGVLLWAIFAVILARYLIVVQPRIDEIPGPYIPLIGYMYFLSVLLIIYSVLQLSQRKS